MQVGLRHHAWLLAGCALALVLVGVDLTSSGAGPGLAPAGLPRLPYAVAAVAAATALHFRAHAVRLARFIARSEADRHRRRDRLLSAVEDLDRSRAVIDDNLQQLAVELPASAASLYLQGARAHAARLQTLVLRLRNLADPPPSDP